jgi:hypothetical protein
MNSGSERKWFFCIFAVALAAMVFAVNMSAQVQTQTTTTAGPTTTDVKVDQAKVVLVDGNDLIVKTEKGRLVHFPNVPETARVTVGDQQLGIHDLNHHYAHDDHDREKSHRHGVERHASAVSHSDAGEREESGIQNSGRAKVQYRRSDDGCVGSEARDENNGNQSNRGARGSR